LTLGQDADARKAGDNLRLARVDPDFDPIRSDPRFQAMIAAAEARVAATKPADGAGSQESA
jgi:hypothetical protein